MRKLLALGDQRAGAHSDLVFPVRLHSSERRRERLRSRDRARYEIRVARVVARVPGIGILERRRRNIGSAFDRLIVSPFASTLAKRPARHRHRNS
jgi:hypothetical protein